MRHRNPRQPLVFGVAVFPELPLQNLLRRRTRQGFVRFVHLRQQLDVGPREAALKTVAAVAGHLHLAVFHVPRHQQRHLRPASPRHFLHVALQQPPHRLALLAVLLHPHRPRDPRVHLRPVLPPESVVLAALQKHLDLFPAQPLGFRHADDHSPASLFLLQARLVLESGSPSGPSCIG